MIPIIAGMVELADTSDLGSDEHSSWRFESSYPYYDWTPVLIQCFSDLASGCFLTKLLVCKFFRYFLTIQALQRFWNGQLWSLWCFTPPYHLTKGLLGVHFVPRWMHLLQSSIKKKAEVVSLLELWFPCRSVKQMYFLATHWQTSMCCE